MTLQERFTQFYHRLDLTSLEQLPAIYAGGVAFQDPVGTHSGLKELDSYFRKLLEGCTDCRFKIDEQQFDQTSGYVNWTMSFSSPRLNGGEIIDVEGVSLLAIDGDRITIQRDYYDLGAMVYEQLPILRRIVRYIRGRMAA